MLPKIIFYATFQCYQKSCLFLQRDLIQTFLDACREYGVHSDTLFETEDLHSAVNMNMVSYKRRQHLTHHLEYAF